MRTPHTKRNGPCLRTTAFAAALLAVAAMPVASADAKVGAAIDPDEPQTLSYDVRLGVNNFETEHSGTWIVGAGGIDCAGSGSVNDDRYRYLCA